MTSTPLPAHLIAVFDTQEKACKSLGSPFTALLCRAIAQFGLPDSQLRAALINWEGDPSVAGDALPVRLCGALHELVLTTASDHLCGVYPPNFDATSAEILHQAVLSAIQNHDDFLSRRLMNAPQTNEVRRATAILAGLLHIAEQTRLPLQISEIGASAGLNLLLDQYSHTILGNEYGKSGSPVVLNPDWHGPPPPKVALKIEERRGCDLSPFDLAKSEDRTRLLSYVWPDQHDRMYRMRAAFDVADTANFRVDRSDAIAWLKGRSLTPVSGRAHVLFHTIAWQYLPDTAKAEGRAIIDEAGSRATAEAPLFLLGMEGDQQSPGAALRLDAWPGGTSVELARVDFHGRWVKWRDSL